MTADFVSVRPANRVPLLADGSIDLVIAELAEALPAESSTAPRTFSFVGLGSSTSGRYARDTDDLLADGFGRD